MKTCCECGWINQDVNLSIREWTCKNGHHLDRDENAARNILNEGLKIIGTGLPDNTGGEEIRPEFQAHSNFRHTLRNPKPICL